MFSTQPFRFFVVVEWRIRSLRGDAIWQFSWLVVRLRFLRSLDIERQTYE